MSNVFLPASARTTLSWTASISGTGAFSVAGHALLWGAGYLYRLEGNDGPELWPLRPDRTRPLRTPAGELVYETTLASGERIPLPAEQVIPLRAIFGGMPAVRLARGANRPDDTRPASGAELQRGPSLYPGGFVPFVATKLTQSPWFLKAPKLCQPPF